MKKYGKITLILTLFAFSFTGILSAGEKDTTPDIEFSGIHFKEGYLRVAVANQEFRKVMDEVARKAGIKIAVNDNTDELLTISFGYLTLEKGLKQLLRERNYVFLYGSDEAHQSSRLMQVLVFPKAEGWTVAGSEGLDKDRPSDQAQQAVIMKNVKEIKIPDNLEDVLLNFTENGVDLKKQIEEAMEKIQEMDILKGIEKMEDVNTREKILKALREIQDIRR